MVVVVVVEMIVVLAMTAVIVTRHLRVNLKKDSNNLNKGERPKLDWTLSPNLKNIRYFSRFRWTLSPNFKNSAHSPNL